MPKLILCLCIDMFRALKIVANISHTCTFGMYICIYTCIAQKEVGMHRKRMTRTKKPVNKLDKFFFL